MKYCENDIFTPDIESDKEPLIYPNVKTEKENFAELDTVCDKSERAADFAKEINENVIGDFERDGDKMCHVSTFCFVDGLVFVSYYASASCGEENPDFQTARLAYAPKNDIKSKVVIDVMKTGEELCGHSVKKVYDTILMQKDDEDDKIYVLFTALVDEQYYRLYRIFDINTKTLTETRVNRFKVGDTVNDFSTSGIKNALTYNGHGYKAMRSDIGIMQKLTSRMENGVRYYYTGAYSGSFTCIIKSSDLITWEYVAQPNEGNGAFDNDILWENATYLLNGKVYYFVRQWEPRYDDTGKMLEGLNRNEQGSLYGILTSYDLEKKEWEKPLLVGDSQSRSDFILYGNELYLFHAPCDRNHIGILRVDQGCVEKSKIILQADMKGSCFYPFVQYGYGGETLCMSYTVDRKHIRLSHFDLGKYVC